jgi:hypothetical protein
MAKYIITAVVESDQTLVMEDGGWYDTGDYVASNRWGVDDPDSEVDYTIEWFTSTRVE